MTKQTKALLSLVGVVAVGAVLGAVLGFDDNSVSFGFIVGTVASVVYSHIKA